MPAQAKSLQDPISKTTREKWTRGVAQEVQRLLCEHLLCNSEVLNSNTSLPTQKKKKSAY
jgi:hypothetical protein